MRNVRGTIVLPPDAPETSAGLLLVEARDVSLMDAPSVVVAELRETDVEIGPGHRIPFELSLPEAGPGRTLALRAHISLDGTDTVSTGDALSVTHIPLPSTGDVDDLEVPVRIV
jgi:uncharacterized lipoprotein YbaY